MNTTICKQQTRVYGLTLLCQECSASLRDAQEQAGVGTRFDVLQSQVQLADETQRLTNSLSQQPLRRQLATRLSLAQSISQPQTLWKWVFGTRSKTVCASFSEPC